MCFGEGERTPHVSVRRTHHVSAPGGGTLSRVGISLLVSFTLCNTLLVKYAANKSIPQSPSATTPLPLPPPTPHVVSTGEAVDRRLLSGLMRMLGDLSLYGTTFSPLLMEETAAFYKQEGQRLIETADLPHYLTHCEVRGLGVWRVGG